MIFVVEPQPGSTSTGIRRLLARGGGRVQRGDMTTTTDSLMRERAAGTARGRRLMLIVLLAGQFMALLDSNAHCARCYPVAHRAA